MIRLVPYWNVNFFNYACCFIKHIIRLVPYWNVNSNISLSIYPKNMIRLVPYWNVNFFSDGVFPNPSTD